MLRIQRGAEQQAEEQRRCRLDCKRSTWVEKVQRAHTVGHECLHVQLTARRHNWSAWEEPIGSCEALRKTLLPCAIYRSHGMLALRNVAGSHSSASKMGRRKTRAEKERPVGSSKVGRWGAWEERVRVEGRLK